MATESGYSNQKKYGTAQFKSIQYVGSSKYGANVGQMLLYDRTPAAIAVASSALDPLKPQEIILGIPGHGAAKGDMLRVITASNSALASWEYDIVRVIDANTLVVYDTASSVAGDTTPQAGDTVKVCRWVSAKAGPEGEISSSGGPNQFIKDGIPVTVTEDTSDPENNIAFPSGLYIYRDGAQVPVTKDTFTPSNTVGIPVEVVAASGTPINITAGDINVQLTDVGVNFDAVRVGDGTGNYISVDASGQASVSDSAALLALGDIESAMATEAKQDDIISELQGIAGIDFATEAKQDDIISELQGIAGVDFATEAKQDDVITELETIKDTLLLNTLVPKEYSEVNLDYDGNDNLIEVEFVQGVTVVSTLTLSYTSGNLTKVVRS